MPKRKMAQASLDNLRPGGAAHKLTKEENAKGADLGFTTFVKVRGGDFYPGMLIREMK